MMMNQQLKSFVEKVLQNFPEDWLKLTTHRLDIYDEEQAKTEFLEGLEKLYTSGDVSKDALAALPTAYDYIRLGHPLSSLLEWVVAKELGLQAEHIIAFGSESMPIMAALRTYQQQKVSPVLFHQGPLPASFDPDLVERVYGYTSAGSDAEDAPKVFVSSSESFAIQPIPDEVDLFIQLFGSLGSMLCISASNADAVGAIQHVRRRETIAMTPVNCLEALNELLGKTRKAIDQAEVDRNRQAVVSEIQSITQTQSKALVGSSGLSVQYAIMMGLVDHALQHHPGQAIAFIVPPNCYGGTNDQARRVAAAVQHVHILDLPVDGDNDMVRSTDKVLDEAAAMNAVPYIIAEIPTNPRVEVPDLDALRSTLAKERKTPSGEKAVDPVFILDQTFCPNVPFLRENGIFSGIQTIAYVSGSKFPSGGKATAGYCVAKQEAEHLMAFIERHLQLCDNEATAHQLKMLAEQMPSMLDRIERAYRNTRDFVNFIEETLPTAKINFVSEALAERGFTPSVFSLDLPTKGSTHEEREAYKRRLNLDLIHRMITEIPNESKYCVSYGQLKGCYWTIPATSTQGTTKEADKDYIARVSVSPDLDLAKHKAVFRAFVDSIS